MVDKAKRLTPEQKDRMIEMLAAGKKHKEISEEIGIGAGTIANMSAKLKKQDKPTTTATAGSEIDPVAALKQLLKNAEQELDVVQKHIDEQLLEKQLEHLKNTIVALENSLKFFS
jgi:transposase-like protein